jgi:DNA-directed RNA polymerase specialized sigma24 family protein
MNSNTSTWNAKYESWRTQEKADEFLVEVLQKGDDGERDIAMQILQDRYADKLIGFIESKLWISNRHDLADDVSQETWMAFDIYSRVKRKSIENVEGLLFGIAKNKIRMTFRGLKNEGNLERNMPPVSEITRSPEKESLDVITRKEQQSVILQLPFSAKIGDCPRIVWTLRYLYNFPIPVIARLLGKSRDIVDVHSTIAKKEIGTYIQSKEYRLETALRAQPWSNEYASPIKTARHLVEMVREPMIIEFTDEELRPLDITADEFRTQYRTSLIMPGPASTLNLKTGYLLAVLTDKHDWNVRANDLKSLLRSPLNEEEVHQQASLREHYFYPSQSRDPSHENLLVLRVEDEHITIVEHIPLNLRPFLDPEAKTLTWHQGVEMVGFEKMVSFSWPEIYFSMHPQRTSKYLPVGLAAVRTQDMLDKLNGIYEAQSHYAGTRIIDGDPEAKIPREISRACSSIFELIALRQAFDRSFGSAIRQHESDVALWYSLLQEIRTKRNEKLTE